MTVSPLDLYRWMAVARVLDQALCAENPNWFPIEGEEATSSGRSPTCRPTDVAAPHYRDPFVVYLMRGAEMWRLAAQVLRKGAGYNKGRSVPFTGPVDLRHRALGRRRPRHHPRDATGAALGVPARGHRRRLCLRLRRRHGQPRRLPRERQPGRLLEAADRLRLPAQRLGDLAAGRELPAGADRRPARPATASPAWRSTATTSRRCARAVGEAVARARRGDGPTLIEARTWRQRGHWAGDAAAYRA